MQTQKISNNLLFGVSNNLNEISRESSDTKSLQRSNSVGKSKASHWHNPYRILTYLRFFIDVFYSLSGLHLSGIESAKEDKINNKRMTIDKPLQKHHDFFLNKHMEEKKVPRLEQGISCIFIPFSSDKY